MKGRTVKLPVGGAWKTVTIGEAVKLSLGTKESPVARRRFAEAHAALVRFYEGVQLGEVMLDFKQATALARSEFDVLAEIAESEPGEPGVWEALQGLNTRVRENPEKMQRWYGESVDRLLEKRGLTVNNPASRNALLRAAANVWEMGTARSLKRARGDFSDDGAGDKISRMDAAPDSSASRREGRKGPSSRARKLWNHHEALGGMGGLRGGQESAFDHPPV